MNLPNVGPCRGTMLYGNTVQFWCQALDGGASDSKIITIEFSNEEVARQIADAAAYKG